MGLALALEEAGVPTVAVHTHVFARLVQGDRARHGHADGAPGLCAAADRRPSAAELRAYIEGTDPISKRPFMQEVIEGLTPPLDEEDLKGVSFERSTPRLLEPETEDRLQRLFVENNWTDFLPITLPTEERVAAMLKGTSHQPDEVVGRLRADRVPRGLGIHGRESGGERRHGRGAAGVLPGHARARRERHHRAIEQHQRRSRRSRSSTARSARKSG